MYINSQCFETALLLSPFKVNKTLHSKKPGCSVHELAGMDICKPVHCSSTRDITQHQLAVIISSEQINHKNKQNQDTIEDGKS